MLPPFGQFLRAFENFRQLSLSLSSTIIVNIIVNTLVQGFVHLKLKFLYFLSDFVLVAELQGARAEPYTSENLVTHRSQKCLVVT